MIYGRVRKSVQVAIVDVYVAFKILQVSYRRNIFTVIESENICLTNKAFNHIMYQNDIYQSDT